MIFFSCFQDGASSNDFRFWSPYLWQSCACASQCGLTSSSAATAFLQWDIRVEKLDVVGA